MYLHHYEVPGIHTSNLSTISTFQRVFFPSDKLWWCVFWTQFQSRNYTGMSAATLIMAHYPGIEERDV